MHSQVAQLTQILQQLQQQLFTLQQQQHQQPVQHPFQPNPHPSTFSPPKVNPPQEFNGDCSKTHSK
jgi:adenylosuccinate lyase